MDVEADAARGTTVHVVPLSEVDSMT
jgi:hypothetical protein